MFSGCEVVFVCPYSLWLLTLVLVWYLQLLDLMHTLHTRAASIYSSWAEEQQHLEAAARKIEADSQTLWTSCWCPLLQGGPWSPAHTLAQQQDINQAQIALFLSFTKFVDCGASCQIYGNNAHLWHMFIRSFRCVIFERSVNPQKGHLLISEPVLKPPDWFDVCSQPVPWLMSEVLYFDKRKDCVRNWTCPPAGPLTLSHFTHDSVWCAKH